MSTVGHATILVINPGSTSTKVAVFRETSEIHKTTIEHPADQLARFDLVVEQFDLRRRAVESWLASLPEKDRRFDAIAGRGAPLKPLEGGTYAVSPRMLDDVRSSRYSNHASNLGPLLAAHFAAVYDVPAYITDPITVDNFTDLARISGLPGIERKCRSHALNIKAVGRAEASRMGRKLDEVNFVVAHMGGGISVAALEQGRIIDVNDGLLGMGPFSPDRAGALPIGSLVDLCFSGAYDKKELLTVLSKKSGLAGYLGEPDLRRVETIIDAGDRNAALIFAAMCYQIAKEIGAAAAALKGRIDGIILTGGMAFSQRLTSTISEYVSFLAPVRLVPGEHEMSALAEGAIRALSGAEPIRIYE
jgi:butyrate kinase